MPAFTLQVPVSIARGRIHLAMAEAGAGEGEQVEKDEFIEEEQFRSPLGVTADEEGEEIVRVCVIIPGLKKKSLMNNKEADNAEIKLKLNTRSLELIVRMKVKDKNKKPKTESYKYEVKQLPDTIVVEDSEKSVKVKKDQIVIKLKKEKARSWSRELSQSGLETMPDPSSGEESSGTTD